MNITSIFQTCFRVSLVVMLCVLVNGVSAAVFVNPINNTTNPPQPISVGNTIQIKTGGLGISAGPGFSAFGDLISTDAADGTTLNALRVNGNTQFDDNIYFGNISDAAYSPQWMRSVFQPIGVDVNGVMSGNGGLFNSIQVPNTGIVDFNNLANVGQTGDTPVCVENGPTGGTLVRCTGVTPYPQPTVTLTANPLRPAPAYANAQVTTTLTWESTNASVCKAIAGPGFVANGLNGSDVSAKFNRNQTFMVACWSPNGRVAVDSVEIILRVPTPVVDIDPGNPIAAAPAGNGMAYSVWGSLVYKVRTSIGGAYGQLQCRNRWETSKPHPVPCPGNNCSKWSNKNHGEWSGWTARFEGSVEQSFYCYKYNHPTANPPAGYVFFEPPPSQFFDPKNHACFPGVGLVPPNQSVAEVRLDVECRNMYDGEYSDVVSESRTISFP